MSRKDEDMDSIEIKLLQELTKAAGKNNAISAPALSQRLDITSRRLRTIINHLIIDHHLPIGSSAGRDNHGYFMISTEAEATEFYQLFRSRGMTGLVKASRIEDVSLLEMSFQLTLDFYRDDEKIPGAVEAVTKLMKLFNKNPQQYSQEIKAMKTEILPLMVDRKKMEEINQAAQNLADLTGGAI